MFFLASFTYLLLVVNKSRLAPIKSITTPIMVNDIWCLHLQEVNIWIIRCLYFNIVLQRLLRSAITFFTEWFYESIAAWVSFFELWEHLSLPGDNCDNESIVALTALLSLIFAIVELAERRVALTFGAAPNVNNVPTLILPAAHENEGAHSR